MKYFTKYLPVEGEIKEGDRVRVKHGAKGIDYVTDPLTKDQSEVAVRLKEQKVKLFLCSRDIQVGDKCFYVDVVGQEKECIFKEIALFEGDTEWWFDFGTKDMSSYHPGYDKNRKPPYKVIGEISPQATWVSEGMEFDEDDLDHSNGVVGVHKLYILVKCPTCKHFH